MMKMLEGFENWKLVEIKTTSDGSQKAIYELNDHRVIVTEADYMPGGLDIRVRAMSQSRYTPEIYVDTQYNEDFQVVKIQTSSWGSLEASEIDKVVEAYTKAQAVAHEIERAFPQCFKAA